MPELRWQKSTYSQEASACVYLATTPAGTILLRESDEPETVVTIDTAHSPHLYPPSKHVHKLRSAGYHRQGKESSAPAAVRTGKVKP
ncbi:MULTISPECIES: DUF397 domain-containing protein [unclassified Streptomyces]|uniref:DUF397 domain-containing protein n=1 Tax=unclassified Streptomyces TaxID=2593676 RepID=UPI00382254E3